MNNWKKYRLGDIISVAGGFAYKGELIGTGDNYLLSMGCVSFADNFLDKGARPYAGDSPERFYAKPGDIVLATRQQSDNLPILGMPAIIPHKYSGKKMIVGANLYRVDFKDPDFDSRYIYWLLKTPLYVGHIRSCQSGTTVRMITKSNIEDFEFYAPQKMERILISDIIWDLDNKKELNRQICANLEQQILSLYKSWFLDFDPFRDKSLTESEIGLIPEGWNVVRLGEVCKCILGGTPSRSHDEYWNGNIPWINSGEVNNFRILSPTEYITQEGLDKSATKLLPVHTTVLAITGATLGQVSLLEIKSCANQSVIGVLENPNIPYCFIYPLINYKIRELMSHMTGGAQQHINKNNVEQLNIVLPPQNILKRYADLTIPLFEKISNCCFQSANLAKTRDTLLPRLMSGELEVKDIEDSL